MNDRDYARALFEMAKKDVQALHGMMDTTISADEIFGFHAQQAVEKCLKAWIAALDTEFPLTHDISLLLSVPEDKNAPVADFWDLVKFTAFAVQFRYAAFEHTEPLNRPDILRKVDALFSHIQTILKPKPSD